MRHRLSLRIGPVSFRVGSVWPGPIAALKRLYAGYPGARDGICDFTVRLEPAGLVRRWLRPSVTIEGDYALPDAAPLPLAQGLLAAEMGMNLQMALGQRRYLLLHAATVEKEGRALILTGLSGAGKSTLAAMLGEAGWRLMGDEFALLGLEDGLLYPFPRAVSLKNGAIGAMEMLARADRFGPLIEGTPKGDIRHLRPREEAVERMGEPARPALILFPCYGADPAVRPVGSAETFVRFTQASTNYVALGRPAFDRLTGLAGGCPAAAIDYRDAKTGMAMVDDLWAELAA